MRLDPGILTDRLIEGEHLDHPPDLDRRDLLIGQRVQRTFAEHHAAANPGQAVGQGLVDIQDAQAVTGHRSATAGAQLGHGLPRGGHEVDDHAVVRTSASDHLPIVADLEIPRSPNGLVR